MPLPPLVIRIESDSHATLDAALTAITRALDDPEVDWSYMHDPAALAIVEHLEKAEATWRANPPAADVVYAGPGEFVLVHGEWFVPTPFQPDLYPQGAPRLCYANALCLALADPKLRYVEGYAMMAGGDVVQHAWNATEGCRLVDSTWMNTGHAYYGVTFAAGRADDATWEGDATVLDDHRRGWPLLRQRWGGETWTGPDVAAVHRLEGLRAAGLAAIALARSGAAPLADEVRVTL